MAENFPIRAGVNLDVKKDDSKLTTVTDHKNFPRLTNKIESFGTIHKKTYAIICDGEGNMSFTELGNKTEKYQDLVSRLQILKSACDTGAIEQKDFEEIRKNIVNELKHV